MIKTRQVTNESMTKLINDALKVIELSKKRLMNKDKALDILWELLVNIKYEIKSSKCTGIKVLMN